MVTLSLVGMAEKVFFGFTAGAILGLLALIGVSLSYLGLRLILMNFNRRILDLEIVLLDALDRARDEAAFLRDSKADRFIDTSIPKPPQDLNIV